MSGRSVSLRCPRLSPAERAAHAAREARLVPVTYTVVAGTPTVPTGSTDTMLEDPERLKKWSKP